MTTETRTPRTIAEVAAFVLANYGRSSSRGTEGAWVLALSGISVEDAWATVVAWMDSHEHPPSPKDIRQIVERKRQVPSESRTAVLIVCQWCGQNVPESHCSLKCQLEDRPNIDRTEARLRGLKNCRPTEERRTALEAYIATKSPSRPYAEPAEETF